jgi:shikimate kinase
MSKPRPSPVVFPANPSCIVLTGFMGAGKTTVGALLAERLGWRFVDSDRVVEKQAGMTVAEIFERSGEAAFRAMEAAAIQKSAESEQLVIAIGGGALEMAATRRFLAERTDCLIVFLEASLETMIDRCAGHTDGPVRPVLADRSRLAERWSQRLPWYRQAHLTVDTGELSPDAVAECILRELEAATRRVDRRDTVSSTAGSRRKPGVPA